MPGFGWLLTTGILVGLATRRIAGGQAYGAVTDALLGITGAFAADWLMEALAPHDPLAWSLRAVLTSLGAAALPAAVHLLATRKPARPTRFAGPTKPCLNPSADSRK